MTNASVISMACDLARMHVESVTHNFRGFFGVLRTFDDCVKSGGFIHPDTTEARWLTEAVKELRSIADDLDAQRKALEANEIATRVMQAAE